MKNKQGDTPEVRQREPEGMSSAMMKEIENNFPEEIEIIGPKKCDTITIKLEDLVGLKIGMVDVKGYCVYEIKIPYEQNQVYSATINAEPGSKIAIGFKTNEIDMEEMRPRTGDRPSGGMPGRGMPGGRPGDNQGVPHSLKAWFTMKLAENP